jgi:hypothetical protein
MSAEVVQLLFALAGAALGWYVRHRSASLPPEVVSVVKTLLDRRQQRQAHSLLEELLDAARQPPAPPKGT